MGNKETELCDIFYKYKSDKCPKIGHSYSSEYYKHLAEYKEKFSNVLEIGIGNNELMVPLCGKDYIIGASLKAWKEFFPKANIYGVDIVEDVIFFEERISCFYTDQSSQEELDKTISEIRKYARDPKMRFDMIIDDGSHIVEHMLLTFESLGEYLMPGGIYIIEDIQKKDLHKFETLDSKEFDVLSVYRGYSDWDNFVIYKKNDGERKDLKEESIQEDSTKERIGIFVMYDENYERMADITIEKNISQYCELHGYKLIRHKIDNPENGRPASWQKIAQAIDILGKGELEWLFLLDVDCLIMNPSIKLESIIDEKYSFIIPSNGVEAIDCPLEDNGFGGDAIIASSILVRGDEMGMAILKNIWDCEGSPEGIDINEFDYEQRQCRITLSNPYFRKHAKIVEERILNRFWYMNSPFMVLYNSGINDLVWKPRDFIVHVTGYSTEERIKLLSDLNYFSGGAIGKFTYQNGTLNLSPLEYLDFSKAFIKDIYGNIVTYTTFERMSHKLNYYISVPGNHEKIVFEAYDELGNIISKKMIIK